MITGILIFDTALKFHLKDFGNARRSEGLYPFSSDLKKLSAEHTKQVEPDRMLCVQRRRTYRDTKKWLHNLNS